MRPSTRRPGADSSAGTQRSTDNDWYGPLHGHPLLAPYGAQKVAESELRLRFNTRVMLLMRWCTRVILRVVDRSASTGRDLPPERRGAVGRPGRQMLLPGVRE